MIAVSSDNGEVMVDLNSSGPTGPLTTLVDEGGAEPMANVANLVDVMLVLACGLMLAIVTFWQIDLPDVTQVLKQREMTEVSDVEDITDRVEQAGSSYNELGTVFEDPETGKMYLIQDDEGASQSDGASAAAGAGNGS